MLCGAAVSRRVALRAALLNHLGLRGGAAVSRRVAPRAALLNHLGWAYAEVRRTRRDSRGLVSLLERMVPLLALAAVLISALAYPLRLHESVLLPLERATGWVGWLFHHELRPVLAYTLSPLTFKESLAECLLLSEGGGVARPYFERAYHTLSQDADLCSREPDRIERLRALGQILA